MRQAIISSALKTISLGDFDKWMQIRIQEKLGGTPSLENVYSIVPWLFRGAYLRAWSIAGVPFGIYDGDNEVDSSADWQNKVGFLDDPESFLLIAELSLTLAGRAYFGKLSNRLAQARKSASGLQYYVPTTITPKLDERTGLTGFERRINTGAPIPIAIEDMLYFWYPDPFVEVGEPNAYPAKAALAAAGVLMNMDEFVSAFFERGAIKTTILQVSGNPSQEEKDRIKETWQRITNGVRNAWQTFVANADALKPVVIGEGIKELENSNLTMQKREDIAAGLNIPQTILFSGSASGLGGGGVTGADNLRFANEFIAPECRWIARGLNRQLFEPLGLGLRLKFKTESLKVFQEDEAIRAVSLKTLIEAVEAATDSDHLRGAMMILGYDVPQEAEQLIFKERPPKREPPPQFVINPRPQLSSGEPMLKTISPLELDLDKWMRKAARRVVVGKSAFCDFESNVIPINVAVRVAEGLHFADSLEQVKAVFEEASADDDAPFRDEYQIYRQRLAEISRGLA